MYLSGLIDGTFYFPIILKPLYLPCVDCTPFFVSSEGIIFFGGDWTVDAEQKCLRFFDVGVRHTRGLHVMVEVGNLACCFFALLIAAAAPFFFQRNLCVHLCDPSFIYSIFFCSGRFY